MSAVTIFVYGSLRRDASGASHPLLRDARFVASATVAGTLYQVDWYPGLVPDADDGEVLGELFELPTDRVDAMLRSLDDYEGGGFKRRRSKVRVDGNSVGDTWVYAYIGPTHALERIESGDYGTPVHRARP